MRLTCQYMDIEYQIGDNVKLDEISGSMGHTTGIGWGMQSSILALRGEGRSM